MRAGQLKHRLLIQTPPLTQDDLGQVRDDLWATVARPWGRVVDLSGSELFKAQAVQSEVSVRVELRRRLDLHDKMRIVKVLRYAAPQIVEILDISAIIESDTKPDTLWVFCTKRRAEGFRTGGMVTEGNLLTEEGDTIVTEDGDVITLESQL